jgi:hypothetical protein
MIQEYKIGEVFQINGLTLRCEKAHKKCKGCFFIRNKECLIRHINESLGFCSGIFRSDQNDVVFVKVED